MAGIIMLIGSDGWLVVTGTMEFYDFPFSWECHKNIIIPTDDLHHFLGVGQPPTRWGQSISLSKDVEKWLIFCKLWPWNAMEKNHGDPLRGIFGYPAFQRDP
jgi:hypothetical protein